VAAAADDGETKQLQDIGMELKDDGKGEHYA